jgi:phytoene dehydrogenase-like protein
MEGLVRPMAELIKDKGGDVRMDSGVDKIVVDGETAIGVRLESGEEIRGGVILSGAHAKHTFFNLIGDQYLEQDFIDYVKRTRETMAMTCVFVSMDQSFLPELECTEFQFAKGLKHTEINALDEIQHKLPENPSIYIDNPCPNDSSLAPPGKCWICLDDSASYRLEGTTWGAEREKHADNMIRQVEKIYPDFRKHIIDMAVMDPTDYESNLNLWEGSIMGPALSLDQMFSMRLFYRTGFKNLYITGMCTHPTGGMIGIPGWNAASAILDDLENEEIVL